jgi:hypothetical protein
MDFDQLEMETRQSLEQTRVAEDLSFCPQAAFIRELALRIKNSRQTLVQKPQAPKDWPSDTKSKSKILAKMKDQELLHPSILPHVKLDMVFIGNRIETLNLTKMRICAMDEGLRKFERCKELVLTGNEVSVLDNVPDSVELLSCNANCVTSVAGLPASGSLKHLGLAYNFLDSLQFLAASPNTSRLANLVSLDLSYNRLVDLHKALRLVSEQLPSLRLLSVWGNPFCLYKDYRKVVLLALPQLMHLDDAEVTEEERDALEALSDQERKSLDYRLLPSILPMHVSITVDTINFVPNGWPASRILASFGPASVPLVIPVPSRASDYAASVAAAQAQASGAAPAGAGKKAPAKGAQPVTPTPAEPVRPADLSPLTSVGSASVEQLLTFAFYNRLRIIPSMHISLDTISDDMSSTTTVAEFDADVSFILSRKSVGIHFSASCEIESREKSFVELGTEKDIVVMRKIEIAGKLILDAGK